MDSFAAPHRLPLPPAHFQDRRAPAPQSLTYPTASSSYTVGDPMSIEPDLEGSDGGTFAVEPSLPEGLALDPATSVISGQPVAEPTVDATAIDQEARLGIRLGTRGAWQEDSVFEAYRSSLTYFSISDMTKSRLRPTPRELTTVPFVASAVNSSTVLIGSGLPESCYQLPVVSRECSKHF